MKFSIIAAVDKNYGIGLAGKLPWRLQGDMDYFKKITTTSQAGKSNVVIMGKNTWLSLPEKFRPLPNRLNVILSSSKDLMVPTGVVLAGSLDQAFSFLTERENINEIFIIGGAYVYNQALKHPDCQRLYLTEIDQVFDCDTFFPVVPDGFIRISESPIQQENGTQYKFVVYKKK